VRGDGGVVRRAAAALAGLVVVIAGFAPAHAAGPLQLTVGTVGAIGSLDPRTGTSHVAHEVWNLQYPTLTTLDPKTLDPAPGLALAWTPASSGNGWVYTLRLGLTWSDGRPVTPDDVVASVERAGGSARALTPRKIEISGASSPSALVNVAPQHVLSTVPNLDTDVRALGVADGAWHVTARTDDSVQLDATRPNGPAVQRIAFRAYSNDDALISALRRGEVDVVSGLPYADALRVDSLPGVTVDHAPDGTQFLLRDNLSDERARQAISLAIDRTALVAKAVDGIGTPGVAPVLAPGAQYGLDDATAQRLDASLDAQPERAHELLARVRLPGALRLAAPSDGTSRRVADYIVRALDQVGVRAEVVDGGPSDLELMHTSTSRNPFGADLFEPSPRVGYSTQLARAHARLERLVARAEVVGLFQPDTLQAFRSNHVTGWLRAPQVGSLVVFAPTIAQYTQLVAAPLPPGEAASTTTYVVGAIGVLAVCAAAFAVAAWIRRRWIA
jgi:ABC-type transport system substrate-binding protein